ncbi:hypothetical protein C8R44DRAFT_875873 [Mycena epipterygia]|nr:hypothetical protein C8R44DRAFT_875873 [Mycena epipterygia]
MSFLVLAAKSPAMASAVELHMVSPAKPQQLLKHLGTRATRDLNAIFDPMSRLPLGFSSEIFMDWLRRYFLVYAVCGVMSHSPLLLLWPYSA